MTEKIRVLYFEGRTLDAALICEQLAADGLPYSVALASRRDHFEATLAEGAFELILIDYNLPDYDAFSALELASERQPGVPLIIISGELGDEKAVECLKRGATDYVLKGRLARLAPVLRRALAEAEERRRREAWFRSLIENGSDLVMVINADGFIRFQSPSLQRVLGYPPASLLGQSVFELVHPADVSPARAAFQTVLSGQSRTMTFEGRFRHRDGHWGVLQSSGRALPTDGNETLVVINSRDVTESKQLEAQLRQARKMEAIGQFATGLAHDFNNLLSVILGNCKVLAMNLAPDGPLRESVVEIGGAAGRAAALTRQLLAFRRRQVLEPRALDLNATVVEAKEMLHRVTGESVRLLIHLEPDLSPVLADPGQLDQLLLNLAFNAHDAMPHGGTLSFETRNVDLHPAYAQAHPGIQPGHYALLAVTDTGTGISPDVQAWIFKPFLTANGVGQGTRLGLAAVHGIVEQSGGHMEVYSLPGLGTTFKLYLPTVEEPAAQAPESLPVQPSREDGGRVLLVDGEA